MKAGVLIRWAAKWARPKEELGMVGIITKKSSTGFWTLWSDGTHSFLENSYKKHIEIVN